MGYYNNDSNLHTLLLIKMAVIESCRRNGKPVTDDDCRVNGAYYHSTIILCYCRYSSMKNLLIS